MRDETEMGNKDRGGQTDRLRQTVGETKVVETKTERQRGTYTE